MTRDPPRQKVSLKERSAALRAKYADQPKTLSANQTGHPKPFENITLGFGDDNRLITIGEAPRLEHMHVLGATGSGKSTFLFNCIVQDIIRGRGVCVLDPHGGQPASLINSVLAFLRQYRYFDTGKVHIIAPNVRDAVVGFNPLAPLPDTDPSVIADALVEAFERAWGDENTQQKPNIRTVLKATFTALSECGLTLSDAKLLYQRHDPHGVRRRIINALENEYARDELERLDELARDPKLGREFQANVIGPINRLNEFVSSDALRDMFSMSEHHGDRTIDLREILNKGHILLVDLQHRGALSKANTDLLGKIIVRYLFLLLNHRRTNEPFFLYVDECHRYLTKDIEDMLAEARKYGLGTILAHQRLRQLGEANDALREAVMESTEIKAVFRLNSPQDAQTMAEMVVPLSLEMPVAASVRPVVVGHTIDWLTSESYGVHEMEGDSETTVLTESIARGRTEIENWAHMVARGTSKAIGTGTATSAAWGSTEGSNTIASASDIMGYTYDPNSGTMIGTPITNVTIGNVQGTAIADFGATSFQRGTSSSLFSSLTESTTIANTAGGGTAISQQVANSTSVGKGKNRSQGITKTAGLSDAVIPVYQDLPTQWHSKDNELYRAGELIRALPIGRAALRFRGNTTFIAVPLPNFLKRP